MITYAHDFAITLVSIVVSLVVTFYGLALTNKSLCSVRRVVHGLASVGAYGPTQHAQHGHELICRNSFTPLCNCAADDNSRFVPIAGVGKVIDMMHN